MPPPPSNEEKAALLPAPVCGVDFSIGEDDGDSILDRDPNMLTSFDEPAGRKRQDSMVSSYSEPSEVKLKKDISWNWNGKFEGLTLVLMLAVMSAVFGSSTQFGFNTGVINNPKEAIQRSFTKESFSDLEMRIAVAIFAVGGMIGALPAGLIADIIGRKNSLLLNNVLVGVAVILQCFAVHPAMFIIGRFVVGINAGFNTVVVPLYISEISPVRLRGSMGVFHQMAIVTTIFISQVFSLSSIFGRPDSEFYGWRILFGMSLIFSIFQLVLLPWLPQSPKYLYIKRKEENAAIRALKALRGNVDIQEELKMMKDEVEESAKRPKVKLMEFFTEPHLRRALAVSVVLHLAQQLSGINGIFYYSNDIFQAAGISHPDLATVFTVGLVLVIVTIVTVFLIEVLGRRTLMLYGLSGMAVCFTFLTSMFCFQYGLYGDSGGPGVTVPGVLLVISSLGIVSLFALGPGAIPWLMVAELFMQEARPVAITIATIVNWLANFIVGLIFPYLFQSCYPYGTIIFTFICACLWTFLYFYLPETKGRSVESITNDFKNQTKKKL